MTKATAEKAEVAKKPQNEVAVSEYADYGVDGFENQTSDDLSIPFIAVLQPMSPQLDTLEDAKAGMLMNTVTDELFDGKKGMDFVPAHTQHVFVEWVPRDSGGGFVAVHEPESEVVAKAREASETYGKYMTENGNDLVETFYVYVILAVEDEPVGMAVIAFTSTKIKVYKHWNTKIRMFTIPTSEGRKIRPPLFAHRVCLKTFQDENKNGKFWNFTLNPTNGNLLDSLLPPGHPLLEAAVKCKEMVTSGTARAAFDSQVKTGDSGDESIPF